MAIQHFTTLLIYIVASYILHECGHLFAAACYGVRVKKLGINAQGIYLQRERTHGFPEFVICMSGMAVNLFLAYYWSGNASLFNWCMVFVNLFSDGKHAIQPLIGARRIRLRMESI